MSDSVYTSWSSVDIWPLTLSVSCCWSRAYPSGLSLVFWPERTCKDLHPSLSCPLCTEEKQEESGQARRDVWHLPLVRFWLNRSTEQRRYQLVDRSWQKQATVVSPSLAVTACPSPLKTSQRQWPHTGVSGAESRLLESYLNHRSVTIASPNTSYSSLGSDEPWTVWRYLSLDLGSVLGGAVFSLLFTTEGTDRC